MFELEFLSQSLWWVINPSNWFSESHARMIALNHGNELQKAFESLLHSERVSLEKLECVDSLSEVFRGVPLRSPWGKRRNCWVTWVGTGRYEIPAQVGINSARHCWFTLHVTSGIPSLSWRGSSYRNGMPEKVWVVTWLFQNAVLP